MINHKKQINTDKALKYSSKHVLAGEDGYISVEGIVLESMTGSDGFLANIEDVDEYSDGDIIVCTTDGDFGLYTYNNTSNIRKDKVDNENNYTLKKLDIHISDDCIYKMETNETNTSDKIIKSFICSGERGIEYYFEI